MAIEYVYPKWIDNALSNGYFSEYNPETKGWKYKNPNKIKNYKFEFNPIKDHNIKRGDIINFEGSYRNESKWIWDGIKLINLYTEIDDYGSVPPNFKVGKDFQPNHWVGIVDHNNIIWLEDELFENIDIYTNNNNIYGRVKIFNINYNIYINSYRLNPPESQIHNDIIICIKNGTMIPFIKDNKLYLRKIEEEKIFEVEYEIIFNDNSINMYNIQKLIDDKQFNITNKWDMHQQKCIFSISNTEYIIEYKLIKNYNNILLKEIKEYIQREKPCFNYVDKQELEVYI
jgi:hypothetical protein